MYNFLPLWNEGKAVQATILSIYDTAGEEKSRQNAMSYKQTSQWN
jgi:hypothetical protein